MKYRVFGKTGFKTSIIGLGFWQAGSRLWGFHGNSVEDTVLRIVDKAYSIGINFYDTAEIYGAGLSEKLLGASVRKLGIRDDVFIATKVAGYRHFRYDVLKTVKRSIKRLGFKPDLVQHHWPPPFYGSICRVVNALEEIVDNGLASYYGLSNYNKALLEKALECTKKHEPVSNQVQYSIGYRVVENKLKSYMDRNNIVLIAWSPLAKGSLAGLDKPRNTAQKNDPVFKTIIRDKELLKTLDMIAEKHGVSKSVVSLAWLVEKNALPIPGTRRIERVIEYSRVFEIKLSREDVELIDKVSSKYIVKWGREYSSLKQLRYIPGVLINLFLTIARGI